MSFQRKVVFANGEIYHIFNQSIANEEIFARKREFSRILHLIDYYRFRQKLSFSRLKLLTRDVRLEYLSETKKQKPLIEIYAYAYMPDHFHILLKQIQDNGIVAFASNIQNGFARYFNIRHNRGGSLFKRPFKAKWIDSEKTLAHVSRYIHLNPVTSYIIEYQELETYPRTSYPFYVGAKKNDLVNTKFIFDIFGSNRNYIDFVSNQVDYQRKLHLIKKHFMD